MTSISISRHAEAVTYARDLFERARVDEVDALFGIKVNWLEKAGNRRFAIEMIKRFMQSRTENLMAVVDVARAGWGIADEALREVILDHLNRGEQMPAYLAAYSMEVVGKRTPRQRGKQKADYLLRDLTMLVAIILVAEEFDLKPTSRDGRNSCACSVVADASSKAGRTMGYKNVAEIWRKYGRAVAPHLAG